MYLDWREEGLDVGGWVEGTAPLVLAIDGVCVPLDLADSRSEPLAPLRCTAVAVAAMLCAYVEARGRVYEREGTPSAALMLLLYEVRASALVIACLTER